LALPIGLFLKFSKKAEVIPYGPFLSLAGWMAFLWGKQLIGWYLGGVIW
jgi:leader peptidase (prepilin peptidase)/N-methyltransferase